MATKNEIIDRFADWFGRRPLPVYCDLDLERTLRQGHSCGKWRILRTGDRFALSHREVKGSLRFRRRNRTRLVMAAVNRHYERQDRDFEFTPEEQAMWDWQINSPKT